MMDSWSKRLAGPEASGRMIAGFVVLGMALRLFRYLADFPLWVDEIALCGNLAELDFDDLGSPLRAAQVAPIGYLATEIAATRLLGFSTWSLRLYSLICGLATVPAFAHLAGRLLRGRARMLAVATFSVSWWPIKLATDVKPYAGDLLFTLGILILAVEWWRRPGHSRWLWALAALATLATPMSLPSVFVTGGVTLCLLPAAFRSGRPRVWAAYAALAILPAALFVEILPLHPMTNATEVVMRDYWADAFPPLDRPWAVPLWLVRSHTGQLFAYPIGSDSGGGTATALAFLVGAAVLWRAGRKRLLALGLAPLGLALLAAAARRYPYGEEARTMQFAAPAICLFAAVGLAALIRLRRDPARRRRLALIATACLLGVGLAQAAFVAAHPYTWWAERELRQFARRFYAEEGRDALLVCSRADLGMTPGPWFWTGSLVKNRRGSEAYHLYRRMYAPDHRDDAGPITATHPLRCVFYESPPEESAEFRAWFARMNENFSLRDRREYVCKPAGMEKIGGPNTYVVLEFVPREDRLALSIDDARNRR